MLLVVTYSQEARQSLRNVCRRHGDTVVRRFGRVALFEATEFGAFQALRLREKHGREVQLERTRPFDAFVSVPERVREAVRAYENREQPALPYATFAADTEYPAPDRMRGSEL